MANVSMKNRSMSSDVTVTHHCSRWLKAVAALFLVFGATLALPGVRLASLGGSPYYVIVGVILLLQNLVAENYLPPALANSALESGR